MTEEKTYTLVFTDSELDTIFDAVNELELSSENDDEIENIHSIVSKIYQVCKVEVK